MNLKLIFSRCCFSVSQPASTIQIQIHLISFAFEAIDSRIYTVRRSMQREFPIDYIALSTHRGPNPPTYRKIH